MIDMISNAIRFDIFLFLSDIYILDANVVLSKFVIINLYNILNSFLILDPQVTYETLMGSGSKTDLCCRTCLDHFCMFVFSFYFKI